MSLSSPLLVWAQVVQLKCSESGTEGVDQLSALGLHKVCVVLVPAGVCSQIYE